MYYSTKLTSFYKTHINTLENTSFDLIYFFVITKLRCSIDENAQSKFGLRYIERYFVIVNKRHKML